MLMSLSIWRDHEINSAQSNPSAELEVLQTKQLRQSDEASTPSRTGPKAYEQRRRTKEGLVAQLSMANSNFYGMVATWVGVVLLIGTLWETNKTASAARAAVDGARESAEKQLRAYVTLNQVEITQFEVGKPLLIRIPMTNTGQTPAHDYRGWFFIESVLAVRIPIHRFRKAKTISRYTLGPGVEATAYEASMEGLVDRPLSGKQHLLITSGLATLFVSGRDYYTDVFGNRHITSYRYQHTGPVDCPHRMKICAEGNKST